jgi:NTE family protein
MQKKKVGLALGGGAARGLAHIGVLRALEANNIRVDFIAGTSAGAVAGAAYANGASPDALKEMMLSMELRDWASLADVSIPHGGFLAGNRVISLLKTIIGDVEFKDLKLPFACVACDLWTGEEVVFKEGSVLEGVRASISIPLVFSVVEHQGRYLVDGGLINQVPVNVARKMGADVVIAVNVIPTLKSRRKKSAAKKMKQPGIFDVMMQVIDITNVKTVMESLEGADVVINPDTKGFNSADFYLAKDLILQGEIAGELAVPEIELALRS